MKRSLKDPNHQLGPARTSRFEKQLLAYALGVAGVAAVTQPAGASIVFTKTNLTLTHGSLNIDLNHDGVTDFTLRNYSTGSSSFYIQKLTVQGGPDASAKVIGETLYTRLNAWGAPINWSIGPNSPKPFVNVKGAPAIMASGVCTFTCNPHGAFGRGSNKFLAFQFAIDGEVYYGWARISARLQNNRITATLTGYAYESTPNTPILAGDRGPTAEAGALPSGPSLGMLSLGAPGLEIWRRE